MTVNPDLEVINSPINKNLEKISRFSIVLSHYTRVTINPLLGGYFCWNNSANRFEVSVIRSPPKKGRTLISSISPAGDGMCFALNRQVYNESLL